MFNSLPAAGPVYDRHLVNVEGGAVAQRAVARAPRLGPEYLCVCVSECVCERGGVCVCACVRVGVYVYAYYTHTVCV